MALRPTPPIGFDKATWKNGTPLPNAIFKPQTGAGATQLTGVMKRPFQIKKLNKGFAPSEAKRNLVLGQNNLEEIKRYTSNGYMKKRLPTIAGSGTATLPPSKRIIKNPKADFTGIKPMNPVTRKPY